MDSRKELTAEGSRGAPERGERLSPPAHRVVELTSPPSPANAQPITCWIAADGERVAQELFAEPSLLTSWGWKLVAVGAERRSMASPIAERWAAADTASIRELARGGARTHLLLGSGDIGDADLDALLEGEGTVLSSVPRPATATDACRLGERIERLRVVPSFRWSEAIGVARPLIAEFLSHGPLAAIALHGREGDATEAGRRGSSAIDALLLDVADLALEFLTGVESIAAIARFRDPASDVAALSAIGRSSEGQLVTFDLADVGGWERRIEFLGPAGRLVLSDATAVHTDRQGAEVERMSFAGPTDRVSAVVESLRTLARARDSATLRAIAGREDRRRLISRLALADATRLSARTGNAESPASVEELAARP